MKVRILGSGSSGGVPRVGSGWGACDPNEPKNRRTRCSILIEGDQGTRVLVDTAPDMREQLLACDVHHIDAVFYTHAHADQAHGIDDLRGVAMTNRARVPIYADPVNLEALTHRFDYCFTRVQGYPPILEAHEITEPVTVNELDIRPLTVPHGPIPALGFRIGDVAYFPDLSDIPDGVMAELDGLDVLILDALRYQPHPCHLTVDQALGFIDRLKPQRAVLTNLHQDLDYSTLQGTLPSGVVPAYDGMEIFS